jgi:hypothetical protein
VRAEDFDQNGEQIRKAVFEISLSIRSTMMISTIAGALREREISSFATPSGFLLFLRPSLLHIVREAFSALRRETATPVGSRGRKIGSGG